MSHWTQIEHERWQRSDGVDVFGGSYGTNPWQALRRRPRGAPHHRDDKAMQWLRKQSHFGFWGVVRRFRTAAACMKAVDKDWPLSVKAKSK